MPDMRPVAAPIFPTAHVQNQPEPHVQYVIQWSGGQVPGQSLQPPYVEAQRKHQCTVAAELWSMDMVLM